AWPPSEVAGGQPHDRGAWLAALPACRAMVATQPAGDQGAEPGGIAVDVRALCRRAPTIDRRYANDPPGKTRPLPKISALANGPAPVNAGDPLRRKFR